MKFEGHGALITGAASGLGAACATQIVADGGKVTLVDLSEERGQALADELGEHAQFIRADVCSDAEINAALDQHAEAFGALHFVLNCAGVATPSRLLSREGESKPLEVFRKVIEINLVGSINVLRLAAARIAKNDPNDAGERGVFINTASVAAFDGQIGQTAYAASKGGIAAMTLPLARELARNGIRVLAIAPGIFDTPMLAGLPEKARASLSQQVPFPSRLGNPHEFASLAKHIIENPMLNGEVIRLDGALRMAAK